MGTLWLPDTGSDDVKHSLVTAMNGMRRFLAGGLAGSSNSQPDPLSPPPPVSPLTISGKPSWPPSTPPSQSASPLIAQELTESPTPSPKASTPGLFLRRDKPRPPPPPEEDQRPGSLSNSPSRAPSHAQSSSSRVNKSARKSIVDPEPNRVSNLLNTRDELLMSLLASEAVVDSRGFEILSSEQVEDLKKVSQLCLLRLCNN